MIDIMLHYIYLEQISFQLDAEAVPMAMIVWAWMSPKSLNQSHRHWSSIHAFELNGGRQPCLMASLGDESQIYSLVQQWLAACGQLTEEAYVYPAALRDKSLRRVEMSNWHAIGRTASENSSAQRIPA
jgi:hemolysin-activating ACP:hemolysin acyltransferase